jgi:DNA-binding CsgD family transcriptional regulator/tetratricopeptide (TPR) repeat protein
VNADLWDNFGMSESASGAVFAGREAELDALLGVLVGLDTTGARTVLVGGDAGIGKTRLVEELRDRARAAGTMVAVGVCTPAEGGGLPYGPVVGVLRDLSRRLDESTAAAILTPARRGLDLLDAPAGDAAAPPSEMGKTRLFEALLTCFTALAERSRVVVVFEDLHWADSTSVEVIDFLARNLGTSPMLLIGTYRRDELNRDESLSRMLAELGRHRAVSQLELAGLDRDATAALMNGVLGHEPEWTLLDAVHGRSDGNPFFAEELTAARDARSLPSALRNVIMLRVDRCSAPARHVADVVATAGGCIDHRLLTVAADLDDESLRTAVAEAVDLHVLAVDGDQFRFRHALQRDAVDEALLPPERARLHSRLAVALSAHPELGADGPGHAAVELAGHWWGAHEWSHALHASIRAADAMATLLAMPEAYAQYERAVSACDRLPDEQGRRAVDYIDLLLKAADAAYLTGAGRRSIELGNAALAAIDVTSDPRRAAVAFKMLGRSAWATADADGAFDAFRRARELLPSDPPSVELAGVLAEEARSYLLIAHDHEAEVRSREAIAVARAVGARAEESHSLTTLGACVAERGDPDAGIALIRDALEIAEELGRPDVLDLAYKILTHVLMNAGRLDEAAQVVFEGIARDEALVGVRLNGAGGNSAEALIRRGRWDEADDLLGRMDDHGVASCVFGPHAVRSILAIRRGRFEEAADRLGQAEALSAGLGTVQTRGWFHMLRAELALEQDRPADAYEEIERALTIAAGTDDNSYRPEMCALGLRALADEHDTARARGRRFDADKLRRLAAALVEQAEGHVVGDGDDGVICPPRPTAFLALCRAEMSRLDAPAPDLWGAAAKRWEEAAEPYPAAYCHWREAEATLASGGGRALAAPAAQAAWLVSSELGAAELRGRVERLAARARVTLAPAASDPDRSPRRTVGEDLGLTAREIEVLAQLALGRTDRQIADELFISKKTVSVHVSNILRKLDAANRFDAAEIGQRAGLN